MTQAITVGANAEDASVPSPKLAGSRRTKSKPLLITSAAGVGDWGPLRTQVPQLLMQAITNRWFRRNSDEKENLLSYRSALDMIV